MARFKKIPQIKKEGKIVYSSEVLDGIVLLALKEIEDVELISSPDSFFGNTSINIKRLKEGVYIDVSVRIHFTQNISDVALKIQEAIRHNVEAMTDYRVVAVNVIVKDVSFDDKTAPGSAEQREEIKEEIKEETKEEN